MPNQKNIFPEKFWYWLTIAASWHDWYFNASKVKLVNDHGGHLLEKTEFTWKTFGAHLKSEVQKFVPNERLAWDAKGSGILAYHAWLIIPRTNECKAITKETQHGLLCRPGKLFMPVRMDKYHQIWLEGLKRKAENE